MDTQAPPQPFLPQPSPGNRSRASSAASRYTPDSYQLPPGQAQPRQDGYFGTPPSQPNYPPQGQATLMVPPSSSPYPAPTPPTSDMRRGSSSGRPRAYSQGLEPPYPTSAQDPYIPRPATHGRHGSHSSARPHRSAHSHRSHASSHRSSHRRHRDSDPRAYPSDDDDEYHSSDDNTAERSRRRSYHRDPDQRHPLAQAQRVDSEVSVRPLKRTNTRRPTVGDTVVAMWDGLKAVLGPRDRP